MSKTNMINKLDELMDQIGTGRWNIMHYLIMCYCTTLPVYHAFGGAFLAPKMDFACKTPISETRQNHSSEEFALVPDMKGYELPENIFNSSSEQCKRYKESGEEILHRDHCKEWVFDNSTFISTLTSEFELICDRNYLRAIYQSIFMIGVSVGCLLSALLADKYGRKGVIVFGVISFTCLGLASSWIKNLSAILACRFLMGTIMPFISSTTYILVVEITEAHFRARIGIMFAIPWALAVTCWAGFAYLIRNWRWLQFAISIPGVFIIPCLWFTDESPRWLAVKGYHDRALKVTKKATRLNHTVLPPDDETLNILRENQDHGMSQNKRTERKAPRKVIAEQIKDTAILFRTPKLRKITVGLYLCYLAVNLVYYGLSLSGGNLSSDPFLYMALSGIVELPAYTLPVLMVSRLGRRISAILCYFISGVTLLALIPIPQDYGWLIMILALVGKITISAAFQIVIFYSSELFPTEVRSRGIGSCFMVSRIGAILAPFITDILGSTVVWAPSLVLGVSSILACAVILTLPETLGIAMPDTINQLEQRQVEAKSWKLFQILRTPAVNRNTTNKC